VSAVITSSGVPDLVTGHRASDRGLKPQRVPEPPILHFTRIRGYFLTKCAIYRSMFYLLYYFNHWLGPISTVTQRNARTTGNALMLS